MTNAKKCIKGFDSHLKCRDFQYEIGKTYEQTGKIKACKNGFHAIDEDSAPLNVFDYYPPTDKRGNLSRYCEVVAEGEIDKQQEKIACSKITIGKEIGIQGVVDAQIAWVKKHGNSENKVYNTGDYSAATNTGDYSVASNSGIDSVATNTGDCSAATNTGYYSVAANTGDRSSASNTGKCSVATNRGYCSVATNTGDRSAATNTGYYSVAANTGDCSVAFNTGKCSGAMNVGYQSSVSVESKDSVALAAGYQSKAKGALGCAIFVVERGDWNGDTYPIKSVCSAIIDGVNVKADTWYTCKNGELVEVVEK